MHVNDQSGQQCKFLGVHTTLCGVVEHWQLRVWFQNWGSVRVKISLSTMQMPISEFNFRPSKCRPLHSATRGGYPPSRRHCELTWVTVNHHNTCIAYVMTVEKEPITVVICDAIGQIQLLCQSFAAVSAAAFVQFPKQFCCDVLSVWFCSEYSPCCVVSGTVMWLYE